jgi:predicted O-methyltransferase YrrM
VTLLQRAVVRASTMVYMRPRLLNPLHALRLVTPRSATSPEELACLGRHARNARTAVEIGTHMGASAVIIAAAMPVGGVLYCIDPWEHAGRGEHPCSSICRRELRRRGVLQRVVLLKGTSAAMEERLPDGVDFIFVDGDHSEPGIRTDWSIVERRLVAGGIVCLHDVLVPEQEPWQALDSSRFFADVIATDARFELIDACHSLAVLRRRA